MSDSMSDSENESKQKYKGKITVNEIVKGYIASKLDKNKSHKHHKNTKEKSHKKEKKHKKRNLIDDISDGSDEAIKTKDKLLEIERNYKQNILARQGKIMDIHSINSKSRSKSREYRKVSRQSDGDSSPTCQQSFSHLNRLSSRLDAKQKLDEEKLVKRLKTMRRARLHPTNVIVLDDEDDEVINDVTHKKINSSCDMLVSPMEIPLPSDTIQKSADDVKPKTVNGEEELKKSLKIKITDTSAAIISSGVDSSKLKNLEKMSGKNTGEIETGKTYLVTGDLASNGLNNKPKNRKEKRKEKAKELGIIEKKVKSKASKSEKKHKIKKSRSRSRSRSILQRHHRHSTRHKSSNKKRHRDRSEISPSRSPSRYHTQRSSYRPHTIQNRLNFDKAKLREIAMKNALNNMSHGFGPIVDFKPEEVVSIRAGGKSVAELTDYCQKIAKGLIAQREEGASAKIDQDDVPFVSYVQSSKEITLNIKNSKQVPIMTAQEKLASSAKLNSLFPVSSGTDHRTTEHEWQIVEKMNPFTEEEIVTKPAQMPKVESVVGKFEGSTGVKVGLSNRDLYGVRAAWPQKKSGPAQPLTDGIGKLLLERMGWKEGEGLGKAGDGMKVPIAVDIKPDRKGLVSLDEDNKLMMAEILMKQSQQTNKPFTGYVDISNKHPVSVLMEMSSKKHWGAPDFVETMIPVPGQLPLFKFKVKMNNVEYPESPSNSNKKVAKMDAAVICLQELGLLPREPLRQVKACVQAPRLAQLGISPGPPPVVASNPRPPPSIPTGLVSGMPPRFHIPIAPAPHPSTFPTPPLMPPPPTPSLSLLTRPTI